MRLHKDHKDWIKKVSTTEHAIEWFNKEDRWVYVVEKLDNVGNIYDLDNPVALDFLVDKVEAYYEKIVYDLGGRHIR